MVRIRSRFMDAISCNVDPFAKMNEQNKILICVSLGEIVFGAYAVYVHMNEVFAKLYCSVEPRTGFEPCDLLEAYPYRLRN